MVGFALALAGAACYALSGERLWLFLPGSVLLWVSLILDGADGVLARVTGQASPRGDYLDHVLDRYSDVAVIVGLTFTPWVPTWLGFAAALGTLLTSYMGTQGHAVGLARNYGGLVGRADRIVMLAAVPPLHAALEFWGIRLPYGLTLLSLALGWLAIGGNLTAIQRFWWGWRDLGREPPAG